MHFARTLFSKSKELLMLKVNSSGQMDLFYEKYKTRPVTNKYSAPALLHEPITASYTQFSQAQVHAVTVISHASYNACRGCQIMPK
jgi:hypothetical protein